MNVARGPAVSVLGRSGRQYQLCYNLKRVARTKGTARDEFSDQTWSVQQSEFHHQFDIVEGTALWVNAKGRLGDYRDQVLELTGGVTGRSEDLSFKTREDCFHSSLTVHLMNCHWATDDWRGYINYLEEAVDKQVSPYAKSACGVFTDCGVDPSHCRWALVERGVHTCESPNRATI